MPELEIIGAAESNFVRTACMACVEKTLTYTLKPAFPDSSEPDAVQPFGKAPVMRYGDLMLAETKAICGFIDRAFDGPALIPRDPSGAAKAEMWISLINTGFDIIFARHYLRAYFCSELPGGAPYRAKIDAVLPAMREMFTILDGELGKRPFLAGETFTLADMFLLPLLYYLDQMPESGAMLRASPNVVTWFDLVSARHSAIETVPPPMPTRA
jgi:glutathione S-transferase